MTVTKKPKKNEQDLEPDARKLGRALFSEEFLDEMVTRSREQGVPLTGKDRQGRADGRATQGHP